ncbi:hypothetical protein GXM_06232 [Nostoc sphaeroides CCNUC1]|uniref:Uncharacterized protein n=2 Tax=Nostoc sphaeroides TaxID=446679 RepID=A0A5P8W7N5_9NOSO|nr:hypothetical protein GXM_06232 [Nostoc sphaeroides CCNUC1]
MVNADKRENFNSLTMTLEKLKQFRTGVYTILGKAKDALFDLMDAVLVTRSVYSFAELSVSPVFRRQWSSVYEAIQDGNPPRTELMKLYIKQLTPREQILLAGDHTAWARPDARTLRERTFEHLAHPMSGAKPLWLVWVGIEMSPLSELWRLYFRRFAIDHWYRFAKQRLHWTLPNLSTPEQCERWSDLLPLMTWELWSARDFVTDNPLPWQKPKPKLSPGRVAQAMGEVFAAIGTPAQAPKPRGKSPGWPEGQTRTRRIRYPTVKKSTTKPKKQTQQSA